MKLKLVAMFMMALMVLTVFGAVSATAAKPTRIVSYDVYVVDVNTLQPVDRNGDGLITTADAIGKISVNLATGQYSFSGKADPNVNYALGIDDTQFAFLPQEFGRYGFDSAQAGRTGSIHMNGVLTPDELQIVTNLVNDPNRVYGSDWMFGITPVAFL